MNVDFKIFQWNVRLLRCAETNFNIVSCGLGQLLAEPGGTVEGTLTGTNSSTVLAIPECVINIPPSDKTMYVVVISCFTEVVIPNIWWGTLRGHI